MDDSADNRIVDERVDFVMPEGGPGQDAAGFSAKAQQEEFLGGISQEPQVKPEQPQSQPKESEWPMGEKKSIEFRDRNGELKKWEYVEYGNPDGIPVLNVHGWLGSSAEGNARLSRALAGEVQESQGLQNLDKPRMESSDKKQPHGGAPKGAEKVRELTAGLKGKYNVIVPELPGFGKTAEMDNPTVDRMADELADFYRALGKKPAVAFGSSAGAILVTKMAVRHPELVGTLVLQGLMTKPDDMEKVPYLLARVVTYKPISRILEFFPTFSKEKFFPATISGVPLPGGNRLFGGKDFKNADAATQKLILDSAKQGHVKTSLDTLRDIGKNIEDEVAQVQAPTIVLDGAAGDLVPIAKSRANAEKLHPEAGTSLGQKLEERRVVYFQVGGAAGENTHNVINTAPEEVAVLINHGVEFFNKEGQVGGKGPKGAMERSAAPFIPPAEQSRLASVRERLSRFARMSR